MLNNNFFRKSVYFGEKAETCSGAARPLMNFFLNLPKRVYQKKKKQTSFSLDTGLVMPLVIFLKLPKPVY